MKEFKEKEIVNTIISIIKNRLSFEFDNITDIERQNFFGPHFGFMPYELGYLLNEIEKEFNILIPEEYLLEPGIKTIKDFVDFIGMN